jgi:lipid-A-disaccharide synthase
MRYFLVVGEASGDAHAAELMRGIMGADAQAEFRYFGGEAMRRVANGCVLDIGALAIMGFWEVVTHLRRIVRNERICRNAIAEFNPEAVILVDFAGFNLRIAKYCHRAGLRVFFYIAPKVWAWKEGRIGKLRDWVDYLMVILPFEPEWFAKRGIDTIYEGNPLVDELAGDTTLAVGSEVFKNQNGLDERPLVALLPGSRLQELRYNLGVMARLAALFPSYQFAVAAAPNLEREVYERLLSEHPEVRIVYGATHRLVKEAQAAVVTSGTATLETAMLGVPEVVVYRGNRLTIWIARRIVKLKWISLVNLILGREAVRELLQEDYTLENTRRELEAILPGGAKRSGVLASIGTLQGEMGDVGVSARLGRRVVELTGA